MASLVDVRELERQVAEQEAVLNELMAQVSVARGRLNALHSLRAAAAVLDAPDSAVATSQGAAHDWPVVSPSGTLLIPGRQPSRKIASTQMVADIVNAADRNLSRDEVHEEFHRLHGNPGNWSSPANALNNALARAADKGLILVLPDGSYGRPDMHDPLEDGEGLFGPASGYKLGRREN